MLTGKDAARGALQEPCRESYRCPLVSEEQVCRSEWRRGVRFPGQSPALRNANFEGRELPLIGGVYAKARGSWRDQFPLWVRSDYGLFIQAPSRLGFWDGPTTKHHSHLCRPRSAPPSPCSPAPNPKQRHPWAGGLSAVAAPEQDPTSTFEDDPAAPPRAPQLPRYSSWHSQSN